MAHFLDRVPIDDAPNLFGQATAISNATVGLGEPDEIGRNQEPTLGHLLTAAEKASYIAVQDWVRRNPLLPTACAFSRLGIDRQVYEAARKKAEATMREAFEVSDQDLIRPGVGIMKDASLRKVRKR